jgi:type I restriction enzyme S subunit
MEVKEASVGYSVAADPRVPAGYKQTEVGVIPEDWNVKPLGNLFNFGGGYTASRDQLTTEGHCYLHYGDIHTSKKSFVDIRSEYQDIPKLNVPLKEVSSASLLDDGDVVFVDASEDNEGTSKHVVIVNPGRIPFISGLHTIVAKARTNELEHQYRRYCFQTRAVKTQFRFFAVGTKVSGISKTNIAKILLPVPTKAEQEAIAEALSDADALIESLEQLLAKKRHLKQGAMQQLLTGKKRLPGFSGEWEVKRLGEVIEKFVGGGTPSRSNAQYWGNEIPWVTVKDFATFNPRQSQEAITRVGLQNSASHLVPKGTLITSTRMALGKAVVYEVDVAINQDIKALFPKPDLATQYLYFWFQYHGQSIDELGSGSTVKGISLPDLKKIEFQLPSLPEQTAIATLLSDMDAELAALEAKLAKARALKQGMMQELLTGRIRLV